MRGANSLIGERQGLTAKERQRNTKTEDFFTTEAQRHGGKQKEKEVFGFKPKMHLNSVSPW
jgi:hypothetical protein